MPLIFIGGVGSGPGRGRWRGAGVVLWVGKDQAEGSCSDGSSGPHELWKRSGCQSDEASGREEGATGGGFVKRTLGTVCMLAGQVGQIAL
jgi:hypothetical protein